MPLISIIIPVFNGEKTIRETIDSVLEQTFTDFELIIINDGSKDQTLRVISSFKDDRITVYSYPNANQAVSRNRGLSHASGEFIAFLDADDLWTPDKLKTQLEALWDNPQAVLVYSWNNLINESGQFLRRGCFVNAVGNVYRKLLLTNFLENGSNPLIRRQALREVGGFEATLTPAEDWDMYLRLAAHYPFVVIPSPQVLYRVSSQSASTHVSKMEAACLKVIERALKEAPESMQYLRPLSLGNLYKTLVYKSLEGFPTRHRSCMAIRYLRLAVWNDPSLLRAGIFLKTVFRILSTMLLPHHQARMFLNRFRNILDTTTIFGYLQLEP